VSYAAIWAGPFQTEGIAAYQRARDAGMSPLRASALGHVGSFKDCWTFRNALAKMARASLRTIGRALAQGRELGLIGTARGGKHETPPGAKAPITCGFSHRWTIGWGKAGQVVQDAIAAARAAFEQRRLVRLACAAVRPAEPPKPTGQPRSQSAPRRRWTSDELDAELAKTGPPDKPDP